MLKRIGSFSTRKPRFHTNKTFNDASVFKEYLETNTDVARILREKPVWADPESHPLFALVARGVHGQNVDRVHMMIRILINEFHVSPSNTLMKFSGKNNLEHAIEKWQSQKVNQSSICSIIIKDESFRTNIIPEQDRLLVCNAIQLAIVLSDDKSELNPVLELLLQSDASTDSQSAISFAHGIGKRQIAQRIEMLFCSQDVSAGAFNSSTTEHVQIQISETLSSIRKAMQRKATIEQLLKDARNIDKEIRDHEEQLKRSEETTIPKIQSLKEEKRAAIEHFKTRIREEEEYIKEERRRHTEAIQHLRSLPTYIETSERATFEEELHGIYDIMETFRREMP